MRWSSIPAAWLLPVVTKFGVNVNLTFMERTVQAQGASHRISHSWQPWSAWASEYTVYKGLHVGCGISVRIRSSQMAICLSTGCNHDHRQERRHPTVITTDGSAVSVAGKCQACHVEVMKPIFRWMPFQPAMIHPGNRILGHSNYVWFFFLSKEMGAAQFNVSFYMLTLSSNSWSCQAIEPIQCLPPSSCEA